MESKIAAFIFAFFASWLTVTTVVDSMNTADDDLIEACERLEDRELVAGCLATVAEASR